MIEGSRQYPLQSYKVPDLRLINTNFLLKLPGKAYESSEKLVSPILAVAKKYVATWQLLATTASDG